MIALGLDIGSNSVGSAWVDTETQEIRVGVSVFPAGVDEADDKRGAPKNQKRRSKRSLRRNLARRAERKRQTRNILSQFGLLPTESQKLAELFRQDPWLLRSKGLDQPLTPHEFGRALVHLGQRRGALGLKLPDPDEEQDREEEDQAAKDDAKVKAAVESTKQRMRECNAGTFGQLMIKEMEARARSLPDSNGGKKTYQHQPIRNRLASFQFHADRSMIHDEFDRLWKRQSEPDGALAQLDEAQRHQLRQALDNPTRDWKWRHQGSLFGQRVTYWNTSTLGRCDLEPTERCISIADRHASYYRVLETVNNIRIKGPRDRLERPLTKEEREKVIERLRFQKTGTVASVRQALNIDKRSLKKQDIPENSWSLNLEKDEDRTLNTDWFHQQIVLGAIGAEEWNQWPESKKEGLNRAILKCDPALDEDADRLRKIAGRIGLDEAAAVRLVAAWQTRPKLENRINLSRRAIEYLLTYMDEAFVVQDRRPGEPLRWHWCRDLEFNPKLHRWPTQIEARQMFADDKSTGTDESTRQRYRIGAQTLTRADRHYMRKHANELPPAPMLSNPVVRKAIHEVRRHVIAHMRAHYGQKPDRIVIEFAREAKKPKKQADWILNMNRKRERIRKSIIEEFIQLAWGNAFHTLSHNQLQEAVNRVILARQQKGMCAYSGDKYGLITEFAAASGKDLEIDHIIPRARGGSNAWSNRVLCYRKSNRDKGRQTPREWWRENFDKHSRPMSFMESHDPAKDAYEFFTKKDYAAKWKCFSCEEVSQDWRGSQLTDTAYAVRQVQSYLQNALWPDEPSHLQGGKRRIFVTHGAYTHHLRKDWQLYQKIIKPSELSTEDVQGASAKNRGDHREHAVDAVAIAFTAIPADESLERDELGHIRTRINDLAKHQQEKEERWLKAREGGRKLAPDERKALPTPWGDTKSFRQQVMSMIYGDFEGRSDDEEQTATPIVVSHRPIGRRIVGAFHEDTLFGPVPNMENTYIGRKAVLQLSPNHLRLPRPETKDDSIKRIASELVATKAVKSKKEATVAAKKIVESPEFLPPSNDPPPEKSGLVRDLDLRKRLRDCIASYDYIERDRDGKIRKQYFLNPDDFNAKEIKQAVEAGAIKHASGVPIKRVKLLRTMTDPVVVHRKRWDAEQNRWVRDTGKDGDIAIDLRSRADRAYVGGNNHHIEIREDAKGKWSGIIISMFEAARRVRKFKQQFKGSAVDRSNDPEQGGKFVMSLSAGETVCMRDPGTGKLDYFVVFKLDKPQTIQFMHHWDARRAVGEKDSEGNVRPNSKREPISVSASKLRDLAPPGHEYPFKVRVSALGEITPLLGD